MNSGHLLGRRGETLGAQYLKKKGYRLVERNYRTGEGEIDLVMLSPVSVLPFMLVFVEVKTRRTRRFGAAVESVTPVKIARIRQAAEHFLLEHEAFSEYHCRFDVLGIECRGASFHIEHIEDAF